MQEEKSEIQEPERPKKPIKQVPLEQQAWFKARQSLEDTTSALYRDLAAQEEKHKVRLQQKRQLLAKRLRKSYAPINPTDDDDIAIDGDLIQGSRIYTRNCLPCHSLAPSTAALNTTGPALGLIYQKRAASDLNYSGYSMALLDAQLYWTAKNLYKYLYSPSTFIKGSKCLFITGGLQSQEDRVDVIKFLKQYSKEMAKNMRIKSEDLHGKDYVKMQMASQREANRKRLND